HPHDGDAKAGGVERRGGVGERAVAADDHQGVHAASCGAHDEVCRRGAAGRAAGHSDRHGQAGVAGAAPEAGRLAQLAGAGDHLGRRQRGERRGGRGQRALAAAPGRRVHDEPQAARPHRPGLRTPWTASTMAPTAARASGARQTLRPIATPAAPPFRAWPIVAVTWPRSLSLPPRTTTGAKHDAVTYRYSSGVPAYLVLMMSAPISAPTRAATASSSTLGSPPKPRGSISAINGTWQARHSLATWPSVARLRPSSSVPQMPITATASAPSRRASSTEAI